MVSSMGWLGLSGFKLTIAGGLLLAPSLRVIDPYVKTNSPIGKSKASDVRGRRCGAFG